MQASLQSTRSYWLLIALLASLFALATLGCEPEKEVETGPEEVNYWEQRKGNCEQVLTSPYAFKKEDVTRCMKVWETYRNVGDMSVDLRSMYAVAFSYAWYNSEDEYTRAIADAALARLCIPRHPMGNDGRIDEQVPTSLQCGAAQMASAEKGAGGAEGGGTQNVAAEEANELAQLRGSVKTEVVSKRNRKKAKRANTKGLRRHNKKAYGDAIDYYKEALKRYPHYVLAKYNMACAYALLGDPESALMHLEELYTWDDPQVNHQLIKARSDKDLYSLRDNPRFKQLTGYLRIVVANGAGEMGVPHIERIVKELEARRYTIAETANDNQVRLNPVIFYRPGFKQYAEEFKTIIGAPRVQMGTINWDTLNDIIIIWGQKEAANIAAENVQNAPIVQGTRAEEDKDALGEITGAVEDTKGAAEDLQKTGEGVGEVVPE